VSDNLPGTPYSKNMENFDLEVLGDTFRRLNPIQRLWTFVLVLSVLDIRSGNDGNGWARAWVQDKDNVFFDYWAEALNYEPDDLRRKILEMEKRARSKTDIAL